MTGGAPLPVREYASAEEARAHAAAVRERMFPAVRNIVFIPALPAAEPVAEIEAPRPADMRPFTPVTTGMVREMRRRRADGQSLRSIAKMVGVTNTTVIRHAGDIPPPEGGWSTGGHKSAISLEAIKRMRRAGFTFKEIGANFGVVEGAIWKRLNAPPSAKFGGGSHKPINRTLQRITRITGVHQAEIRRDRVPDPRRGAREVSRARHILFWLLVRRQKMSLSDAGYSAGGFDHTSVLFGVRRVDRVIKHFGIDPAQYPIQIMRELWAADWTACK